MSRFFLAFGLVSYLAVASVDGSTCDEGGCAQGCSSDDDEGACPANCPDCSGCPHLNLLVVTESRSLPPSALVPVPELPAPVRPSPEPREILHVPKAFLA